MYGNDTPGAAGSGSPGRDLEASGTYVERRRPEPGALLSFLKILFFVKLSEVSHKERQIS